MLPITRGKRISPWRDRVFAADLPTDSLGSKLPSPLVLQHSSSGVLCSRLGVVKAGGSPRIVPLVRPLAIASPKKAFDFDPLPLFFSGLPAGASNQA